MPDETNLSREVPAQGEDPLLSLAALFEDEFSLDWLEELTGARASIVLSVLEGAAEKGLLSRRRPAVYCFADKVRRKELADRIVSGECERRHREIADILIRELPDADRSVLQVSQHLLRVPVDWRGCQWLVRAGRIFVESLSAEKATACFTHVLTGLSGKRGDGEDRLFIETAMALSNVFAGRKDMDRSVTFLLEARQRARRLHDKCYEILLEMHLAKFERLRSEFNQALGRFERAFAKAEATGDQDLLAATAMFHTYFLFWQGRFKDVIDVYERSVSEVDGYPVGRFPLIAAIMVGHCYGMTGQANLGLGLLDAIRHYCLERGDTYLSSHAAASIAMVMLSMNHIEEAMKYLMKGLREAEESNNCWARAITSLILALLCHLKGDGKGASRHLRSFHRNGTVVGVDSVLTPYLLDTCWAMESTNMRRLPHMSLGEQIDNALAQRNVFLKGLALRYEALKGLKEGRPPVEMARLLALSISHLKTAGHCTELGKTYIELGRLYLSVRNVRRGRATLRMASEILLPINPELIPDDLKALVGDEYREASILGTILHSRHYMGTTGDDKKVFQWVVVTANRLVGAERAALLLREGPESSALLVRASKNLTKSEIEEPGFTDSRKVIAEVMASGKGRIFQTSRDGEALSSSGLEVRSRICVPLVLNGKVVGVLYHENRLLNGIFEEWHLDLLAFFATVVVLNLLREKTNATDREKRGSDYASGPAIIAEDIEESPENRIVGSSRSIRRLLRAVSEVTQTDAPVLILGETGVGKNLIAGAIHRRSRRRDGPFITVQCSALTESLITSELFGHEKGAFTGATDTRIGRFELANGGTLFLDEIGDLTLEVQARLLRVLQTKEFERVGGGRRTITSDFRLIAATNRDLAEEVKHKRFREDLYYRINVLPLHIPPLRERKEDIPLLARHFIASHSTKRGSGSREIPREAIDSLVAYDWPGNVRELENMVQRGLLASHGSEFKLPPLETRISSGPRRVGLKRLDEVERDHILQALEARGWKIRGPGGTAEVLGMNPSTLRSRMKKLGILRIKE
jgi:formate hydrogenlyase transcriptional activator